MQMQQQPPQQAQPARQPRAMPQQQQEATPEQVEQIKRGYQIAHNILYGNEGSIIEQAMQSVTDPKVNSNLVIAQAIVKILDKIEEELGQLEVAVLMPLGMLLVKEISDGLAKVTGRPISREDRKAIIQRAIKLWMQENGQGLDPQALQAMLAQGGGQPDQGQQAAPQQPGGGGGLLAQATGG